MQLLKRSPLTMGLALLFSSSSYAAEPVFLDNLTSNKIEQIFTITSKQQNMQVQAGDALQLKSKHTDKQGVTHMRMQQHYMGFPVFGGYAILHRSTNSSTLDQKSSPQITGLVYLNLSAELGNPSPSFTNDATIALQQYKNHFSEGVITTEHITPIVYINDKHQALWAYHMSLFIEKSDAIPESPNAIIDAKTLHPLVQWNEVKTLKSGITAQGFGGNARIGEYQYGKQLPLLSLTRDHAIGRCYMENAHVKVIDMRHGYGNTMLPTMAFDCMTPSDVYWTGYHADGYDRYNGGYSPSNDALYNGQIIEQMYKEWYDLDVLTQQDKPTQLVMRVHYGNRYENAFWDGRQMTFGDGFSNFYPLTSLGISAHEISHGFTEQQSDLTYFSQSGGMNESFSDMAAQAAEYFSSGKNSWQIGAEVFKTPGQALRYMDLPSRDGESIDSATAYEKEMDVHLSSGVYNRLFYLIATQPGWDPKQAFHVMVKANMDYWTPYSTFDEGACGVIYAARDLGFEATGIRKALDAVAVRHKQCK